MSANPGPDRTARSSATVLYLLAVTAIWLYTASGEPSERSSVATGEPFRRRAASSPTARAKRGWWVTWAPARQSAIASR